MILRLPIKVELFNENGEMVYSFTSTKKSQVRLRVHGVSRSEWAFGNCRVWYNKPNDFWNEFRFTNLAQLDAGLITVTEKPLVDFMREEIPKEYLEKRKMSAAQLKAIANARKNSAMVGGAR